MFKMPNVARDLIAYLDPCLPTYLEELHQLCAIESSTQHKSDIDQMVDWVCRWVKPHHWEVRKYPDQEAGESIVITAPGGVPNGLRVLLTTHLDMLLPIPAFARQQVRRNGDRLICPGVADNKGGLLSGLYTLAALEELGLLEPFGVISLACGRDGEDEEYGMRASAALLRQLAPGYDISFVLEPGCENGDIIGERRGCGRFILEIHGQMARSDATELTDENVIVTLSKQIIALQQLNSMRAGITVNTTVVQGEAFPFSEANVGHAVIVAWIESSEEKEMVNKAIMQITSTPSTSSITTTLESDWRFAPVEQTTENVALATLARTCAHELNFDIIARRRDDISYANILAGLGLPVLDGLGPTGGHLHSHDEYINVSSIMPRIALLALLMVRKAEHSL